MTPQVPRARRYPLALPVRFRPLGAVDWCDGRTENISRSGILFAAGDQGLEVGGAVELGLVLTRDPVAQVLCVADVVRRAVEERPWSVAARFRSYRFGEDAEDGDDE